MFCFGFLGKFLMVLDLFVINFNLTLHKDMPSQIKIKFYYINLVC